MRRLLLGTLLALSVTLLPRVVQAETDSCDCFCGSQGAGAYQPYTDPVSKTTCQEMCDDAGDTVIGCYTSRDQWPDKSEMCWNKTECTTQGEGYTWDDDAENCWDHGAGDIAMGFCYKPPQTATLLQPFGGNTSFAGIPEYVSAIYQYIVPVMALLAVVMLMISGLQYILARGDASMIKKAKSRIAGAITGLILLMSAWTIANVLDPRLVNLKQLRIPQQKKIVLLSSESTCEYLASVGYGIAKTSSSTSEIFYSTDVAGTCGTEGYVRDVGRVNGNVQGGVWKVDDKCKYSGCSDGGMCTGDGSCIACAAAGSAVPSISSDTCEMFERTTSAKNDNEMLCRYVAAFESAGPTCGQGSLQCKTLKGSGGCRDYDASNFVVAGNSSFIRADTFLSAAEFKTYCESDYCGLAGGGRSCTVSTGTSGFDCVNAAVDSVILNAEGKIQGGDCYNVNGDLYSCVK